METESANNNNDFSVDLEEPEEPNTGMIAPGALTREAPYSSRFPGCTPKNLKKRRQTVIATCLMLGAGLIMLCVGAGLATQSETMQSAGIALLVIGSLCALPGSYSAYMLYKVVTAVLSSRS